MKLWQKDLDFEEPGTKSLLYKMASDAFVSYYRKTQIAARYEESMELRVETSNPLEKLEYKEMHDRYVASLNEMNNNQREVFLMNRSEEMTYKEIAEQLDISVKAVEKRMSQALSFLRERLIKK